MDPDCGDEELKRRANYLQVIKYLFEISKHARGPESEFQTLDMARILLFRATRGVARGKGAASPQHRLTSGRAPGGRAVSGNNLQASKPHKAGQGAGVKVGWGGVRRMATRGG